MISTFKLKQQTIEGIYLNDLFGQASEIAAFAGKIGSSGFALSVIENSVTFSGVDGYGDVVVRSGQVVTFTSGEVQVHNRDEFFNLYEEHVM